MNKPILITVPDKETTQPKLRRCVPGKSWFNGCNRCYCNGNSEEMSFLSCTRKLCPWNPEYIAPPADFYESE